VGFFDSLQPVKGGATVLLLVDPGEEGLDGGFGGLGGV